MVAWLASIIVSGGWSCRLTQRRVNISVQRPTVFDENRVNSTDIFRKFWDSAVGRWNVFAQLKSQCWRTNLDIVWKTRPNDWSVLIRLLKYCRRSIVCWSVGYENVFQPRLFRKFRTFGELSPQTYWMKRWTAFYKRQLVTNSRD